MKWREILRPHLVAREVREASTQSAYRCIVCAGCKCTYQCRALKNMIRVGIEYMMRIATVFIGQSRTNGGFSASVWAKSGARGARANPVGGGGEKKSWGWGRWGEGKTEEDGRSHEVCVWCEKKGGQRDQIGTVAMS